MDRIIQKQIDDLVVELEKSGQQIDDPVSRLMVVALVQQAQKIKDTIGRIPEKIVDRLSTCFIPRNKVDAVPAIALVQPTLKRKNDLQPHNLIAGASFSYKIDAKQHLSYLPLFASLIIPCSHQHLLTPRVLKSGSVISPVAFKEQGRVWLGLEVDADIETFTHLSFFIKGTNGVLPQKVFVGNGTVELAFTPVTHMENIPMIEPFDSQQSLDTFFDVVCCWKNALGNIDEGQLIYITDERCDRDAFKCTAYPRSFQQFLESSDLDLFGNNTLWITFDFGRDYEVPDTIEIQPNIIPVVNVNVDSVTLTHSAPIAKLTKNDGSYFLKVIETSSSSRKQGFNMVNEEVAIRDFDACCYNSEALYNDVRNLYNRFIDDYYAFIDYHGLKDGELIKTLREIVNRIGRGVQDPSKGANRFEEGTYAMRNVNLTNLSSSVKVSYLTTFGRLGNTPQSGGVMENKKDAAIEKEVQVIVSATGGENKADADMKYEMLRYYTMTSDRLFTRMDIDAFLRMQLLKEFGKEEMKRIVYDIKIQGAGGASGLARGLYIDLLFRDHKNFKKASSLALDRKIRQMIIDRSCISMPISVRLKSLDIAL